MQKTSPLSHFLKMSNPLALLGGALFYALGVGIEFYLHGTVDWAHYWLGQACVTLLQLTSFYLKAVYDQPVNSAGAKNNHGEERLLHNTILLAAYSTLAVGTAFIILLVISKAISPAGYLILGIAFLLVLVYAVPPLRLVYSGYGELLQAFLVASLIPALGFILQSGSYHRLLAMLAFPLLALYLALLLVFSLPNYGEDMRLERRTLMVRIGWQNGMNLHNFLILGGYLLLGIAAVLGLPWSITWKGLLSLPVGLFQIWQMWQISNGAKPHWNLLRITAISSLALTAYFLTFALWAG